MKLDSITVAFWCRDHPRLAWTIPIVAALLFGLAIWMWREHQQFVYDCKHQVMERILADAHGWYYGAHGEGLSTEQADLVYNDASDALRDLGNATSK